MAEQDGVWEGNIQKLADLIDSGNAISNIQIAKELQLRKKDVNTKLKELSLRSIEWQRRVSKVEIKRSNWTSENEENLIKALQKYYPDYKSIASELPMFDVDQLYNKVKRLFDKESGRQKLANVLGGWVHDCSSSQLRKRLEDTARDARNKMCTLKEKREYVDRVLDEKIKFKKDSSNQLYKHKHGSYTRIYGEIFKEKDTHDDNIALLYNEKINIVGKLYDDEFAYKEYGGPSLLHHGDQNFRPVSVKRALHSEAATGFSPHMMVATGEPFFYIEYLPSHSKGPLRAELIALPSLCKYFTDPKIRTLDSNGLEDFPVASVVRSRGNVEWITHPACKILADTNGVDFMVTSRLPSASPFILRLSSAFTTQTPGESSPLEYFEVRLVAACGKIAIGTIAGSLGKNLCGPIPEHDSCWLTMDGKIVGGWGEVENGDATLPATWPITATQFGPELKCEETVGVGFDYLTSSLFFTRFVKGKMVKFVVESYCPADQLCYPAIVMSGFGTKVRVDTLANSEDKTRECGWWNTCPKISKSQRANESSQETATAVEHNETCQESPVKKNVSLAVPLSPVTPTKTIPIEITSAASSPVPEKKKKNKGKKKTKKEKRPAKRVKREVPESPEEWIKTIGMNEYWELMVIKKYDTFAALVCMNDFALNDLGITIPAHRNILVTRAVELKETLEG